MTASFTESRFWTEHFWFHSEDWIWLLLGEALHSYHLILWMCSCLTDFSQIMNMYQHSQAGGWSRADGIRFVQMILLLAVVSLLPAECFYVIKKSCLALSLHADEKLFTPAASCCITNLLSAHTGESMHNCPVLWLFTAFYGEKRKCSTLSAFNPGFKKTFWGFS